MDDEFDLINFAIRICNIWVVALFYYNLFPFTLLYALGPIAVISFFIWYGIVGKFRRLKPIDYMFIKNVWHIVKYGNIMFAAGYCMFDRYLYGKIYFYSFIMLGISVVYVFVDFSPLYRNPEVQKKAEDSFCESRYRFITDFQRCNPLFGQQYRKEHRDY